MNLTVEQIVQSDYCRVVTLKVEARPKTEMMALRYQNGGGGSVILGSTVSKGKRVRHVEGTLTLASVLCESNSCHVAMLLESPPAGGITASGHGSYPLAPGATLASVVSLTATNGLYALDRPLMIGKRAGETMRLIVGRWNSDQASEKK